MSVKLLQRKLANQDSGRLSGNPASEVQHSRLTSMDTIYIMGKLRYQDSIWNLNKIQNKSLLLELLEKSLTKGFKEGIFTASMRLGRYAQRQDSVAQALKYFSIALPYAETPQNIYKAAGFYRLVGSCYSHLGQFNKAVNYYYKALPLISNSTKLKQPVDSFEVYNSLGIVWSRLQEQTYSLNAFREAYNIGQRISDPEMLAMSAGNIAELYLRQDDTATAEMYFFKVLEFSRQRSAEQVNIGSALDGLAQIAMRRRDYTHATAYLNKALTEPALSRLSPYELTSLMATQGTLYHERNMPDMAKKILIKALANAKALHNEELLEILERKLSQMYLSEGKYISAFEHLQRYASLRDSVFKQEKSRAFEAWTNNRIAEKDKAMLTQQLLITRQDSRIQKKNLLIGGTVAGTLLLLIVSFVLVRNYRHRQVIQQAQITYLKDQQQMSRLKAKVQGEEEERMRIGRELHDNISSQLWSIKLNIDILRRGNDAWPEKQEKLDTIYRQLDDAGHDVRRTAHNLMPDLLLDDGIATALASICEKTKQSTGIEVNFQEYGVIPVLEKEIELSIYRMVQELIQNALKHAQNATYLLVQVSCVNMLLNITIEDNGKAYSELKEGVGLQQIRLRILALKGHFDLQSTQGNGTTAYLEFDLRHFL